MSDDNQNGEPGEIIGGRYEILELLGQGGMGAVHRARHVDLKKEVALKLLHRQFAFEGDVIERFIREARAAATIGHPGIVEVFDLGQDERGTFLAMEKLEGEELHDRIQSGHPLPIGFVARVVSEIADAVQAAHDAGIVHRDLKPQNVFLAKRGRQRDVVKVLDFGIAKLIEVEGPGVQLTQTGQVFGTPLYMSPEHLRSAKDLDGRTDVYAIGAILYECLCGRPPFDAESYAELMVQVLSGDPPPIRERRPDVPEELVAIVEEAMAKDRDARIPTARALADRLEPFIDSAITAPTREPVSSAPAAFAPTVASEFPTASRPRPPLLPIVLALVALLAIGTVVALTVGGPDVAPTSPAVGAPALTTPTDEPTAPEPHAAAENSEPAAATHTAPPRRVTFASEPAGAAVILGSDRVVLCQTPCATELPAEPVEVSIELPGHVPALRALEPPFPGRLDVELHRIARRRTRRSPITLMADEPPPLKTR